MKRRNRQKMTHALRKCLVRARLANRALHDRIAHCTLEAHYGGRISYTALRAQ